MGFFYFSYIYTIGAFQKIYNLENGENMNKKVLSSIPMLFPVVNISMNINKHEESIEVGEFLKLVEIEASSYFKNRKFIVADYKITDNILFVYFINAGYMKISLDDLNVLEFNPNYRNIKYAKNRSAKKIDLSKINKNIRNSQNFNL